MVPKYKEHIATVLLTDRLIGTSSRDLARERWPWRIVVDDEIAIKAARVLDVGIERIGGDDPDARSEAILRAVES